MFGSTPQKPAATATATATTTFEAPLGIGGAHKFVQGDRVSFNGDDMEYEFIKYAKNGRATIKRGNSSKTVKPNNLKAIYD